MAVTLHDVMGDQSEKLIDDTVNFCEMLRVNLHLLQLFQNLMAALGRHLKGRREQERDGWARLGWAHLASLHLRSMLFTFLSPKFFLSTRISLKALRICYVSLNRCA